MFEASLVVIQVFLILFVLNVHVGSLLRTETSGRLTGRCGGDARRSRVPRSSLSPSATTFREKTGSFQVFFFTTFREFFSCKATFSGQFWRVGLSNSAPVRELPSVTNYCLFARYSLFNFCQLGQDFVAAKWSPNGLQTPSNF